MPRRETFARALRHELVEAYAHARSHGGDAHDVRCEVIGWLLAVAGVGTLDEAAHAAFNEDVDERLASLQARHA